MTVLQWLHEHEKKDVQYFDTIEVFSQGKGLLFSGSIKDFKTFGWRLLENEIVQKPYKFKTEGVNYIEMWI